MPWPNTAATHYHAELGMGDKGCAIKELIVKKACGHMHYTSCTTIKQNLVQKCTKIRFCGASHSHGYMAFLQLAEIQLDVFFV